MISSLYLKNFAAFTDLGVKFSPGINIIIGENGTGKTQLLKAILALCGDRKPERNGPANSSPASSAGCIIHSAGKWASCAVLADAGMRCLVPPLRWDKR